MAKKKTPSEPRWNKEELMKRHDFEYVRKHFYDKDYTLEDVRGDIYLVYNDNLELTQLSAVGKNTVRVTNYFVDETQYKATSVRAKMSPNQAIRDDDALCEIFNRIDKHQHFFNIRKDAEIKLRSDGYTDDIMYPDEETWNSYSDLQKQAILDMREFYTESINKADLKEVRRAVAHMPSFHRVSQFPNHVAQRIYERYAPITNGVILDSSSGWGNRLMAAMSSKNGYKYLGTDPNSEMHPNYRALADTIYSTIYKDKEPGIGRKYPEDYFDIRDQGSEFDIPEWHNNTGYDITEDENGNKVYTNKFTGKSTTVTGKLDVPHFEKDITDEIYGTKFHWEHPLKEGYGLNDTNQFHTTGAKLEPIMETHDESVYYSGTGDLSFTSPPYFFLECYTEDSQKGDLSSGQSAGKGSNYLNWVKDFMYPTIINHFNFLKPGGYYIYNLKDLPKDNLFLYSDWLSACLDVGFELIEQPEMILKSKRNFGLNEDGVERINFKGATELVGVLRKPLKHTDEHIKTDSYDALYHIQNNFSYPIISICRPDGFKSKLPEAVENFLKKKYEGVHYKGVKQKKHK